MTPGLQVPRRIDGQSSLMNTVPSAPTDFCPFKLTHIQTNFIAADSNDAALPLANDAADLKVVLDFAEITDSKHIKNLKILFIRVVDLVLSCLRAAFLEQPCHMSWCR